MLLVVSIMLYKFSIYWNISDVDSHMFFTMTIFLFTSSSFNICKMTGLSNVLPNCVHLTKILLFRLSRVVVKKSELISS